MPPPRSLTQLISFEGHVAYLRHFISNLSRRCKSFKTLINKNAKFKWDEHHKCVFEDIKKYLTIPLMLVASILGKSLILYISTLDEIVGHFLNKKRRNKNALYYISHYLILSTINYHPIKKHLHNMLYHKKI